MDSTFFHDKTLLIVGGTGSFGNKVLEMFLNSDFKEIRIFSRDEKKQDDMRKKYPREKIRYYLGDVREESSLMEAMKGVDYVFHAAALKQVPSCESFPMETIKTNVLGSYHVIHSAISCGVKKIVCLSTDKAAYPINTMGLSKALMEKIALAEAKRLGPDSKTIICLTRYGNVMGSRGSVIPLFYKQLKEQKKLTITNPKMTRYMMTLEQAVQLVMFAFLYGEQGDLFVQKSPGVTIETLAEAVMKYQNSEASIQIIGRRPGEKDHEVLVTKEEMTKAEDLGDYFRIPMDGDASSQGFPDETSLEDVKPYTSNYTTQLDVDGMVSLLKKMGEIEE